MSNFMQPEIIEGFWVEIDGPAGVTVIPSGLVDLSKAPNHENPVLTDEQEEYFLQFYEGGDVSEVTIKWGWGARLSAPGYLDATEWSLHKSKEDAEKYLEEMYGDD